MKSCLQEKKSVKLCIYLHQWGNRAEIMWQKYGFSGIFCVKIINSVTLFMKNMNLIKMVEIFKIMGVKIWILWHFFS